MRSVVFAALAAILSLAAPAALAAEWQLAEPGYDWAFPADHYSHSGYRTEWWYVTGHLASVEQPSRTFGFQFTIFRIGLTPDVIPSDSAWASANLIMGHASLGEKQIGRHRFSEVLYRQSPLLAGFGDTTDELIAWSRGPAGTPDAWRVEWNGSAFDFEMADRSQGFSYRLTTVAVKPLTFHGADGYSPKTADGSAASLYYSFTRLEVRGTVEVDGETLEVRGTGWADREIGSGQLAEHQQGWDWFSLQLDDGRDVMLYILRDQAGAVDYGRGTVVAADGSARVLESDDWQVHSTNQWISPDTDIEYPSGWRVGIPSEHLDLRLVPIFKNQENRSGRTGIAYWEGAIRVESTDGNPIGQGYVELTGYGESHRPAW